MHIAVAAAWCIMLAWSTAPLLASLKNAKIAENHKSFSLQKIRRQWPTPLNARFASQTLSWAISHFYVESATQISNYLKIACFFAECVLSWDQQKVSYPREGLVAVLNADALWKNTND